MTRGGFGATGKHFRSEHKVRSLFLSPHNPRFTAERGSGAHRERLALPEPDQVFAQASSTGILIAKKAVRTETCKDVAKQPNFQKCLFSLPISLSGDAGVADLRFTVWRATAGKGKPFKCGGKTLQVDKSFLSKPSAAPTAHLLTFPHAEGKGTLELDVLLFVGKQWPAAGAALGDEKVSSVSESPHDGGAAPPTQGPGPASPQHPHAESRQSFDADTSALSTRGRGEPSTSAIRSDTAQVVDTAVPPHSLVSVTVLYATSAFASQARGFAAPSAVVAARLGAAYRVTRVCTSSERPSWNETLVLPVSQLGEERQDHLVVAVFDTRSHHVLGNLSVSLAECAPNTTTGIRVPLLAGGDVCLNLTHLVPSFSGKEAAGRSAEGTAGHYSHADEEQNPSGRSLAFEIVRNVARYRTWADETYVRVRYVSDVDSYTSRVVATCTDLLAADRAMRGSDTVAVQSIEKHWSALAARLPRVDTAAKEGEHEHGRDTQRPGGENELHTSEAPETDTIAAASPRTERAHDTDVAMLHSNGNREGEAQDAQEQRRVSGSSGVAQRSPCDASAPLLPLAANGATFPLDDTGTGRLDFAHGKHSAALVSLAAQKQNLGDRPGLVLEYFQRGSVAELRAQLDWIHPLFAGFATVPFDDWPDLFTGTEEQVDIHAPFHAVPLFCPTGPAKALGAGVWQQERGAVLTTPAALHARAFLVAPKAVPHVLSTQEASSQSTAQQKDGVIDNKNASKLSGTGRAEALQGAQMHGLLEQLRELSHRGVYSDPSATAALGQANQPEDAASIIPVLQARDERLRSEIRALKELVSGRERLIEELIHEAKSREAYYENYDEHIARAERETERYRNEMLHYKNVLAQRIQEEREVEGKLDNVQNIENLSPQALRDRLRDLVAIARQATARANARDRRLEELSAKAAEHALVAKKFAQLQKAHVAQATVLQNLQDAAQKLTKLKETVKIQEKVIDGLQGRIQDLASKRKAERPPPDDDKKAAVRPGARTLSRASSRLSMAPESNVEVDKKLKAQEEEISKLQKQLKEAADLGSLLKSGNDNATKRVIQKLTSRAEAAEKRCKLLERQITTNTQNYGGEIARLQIALKEARAGNAEKKGRNG